MIYNQSKPTSKTAWDGMSVICCDTNPDSEEASSLVLYPPVAPRWLTLGPKTTAVCRAPLLCPFFTPAPSSTHREAVPSNRRSKQTNGSIEKIPQLRSSPFLWQYRSDRPCSVLHRCFYERKLLQDSKFEDRNRLFPRRPPCVNVKITFPFFPSRNKWDVIYFRSLFRFRYYFLFLRRGVSPSSSIVFSSTPAFSSTGFNTFFLTFFHPDASRKSMRSFVQLMIALFAASQSFSFLFSVRYSCLLPP